MPAFDKLERPYLKNKQTKAKGWNPGSKGKEKNPNMNYTLELCPNCFLAIRKYNIECCIENHVKFSIQVNNL